MTSKKDNLSEKKVATQNISISPALKSWVKQFVKKKHAQEPDSEMYRSVSSFICEILEKALTQFESGKKLEEIDDIMKDEVDSIYSKFSGNLFLPFTEPATELNAYVPFKFHSLRGIFMQMFKFYFSDLLDTNRNIEGLQKFFERIRTRYLKTGLTQEMNLQSNFGEGKDRWIIEHIGTTYRYLHYLNIKLIGAMIGLLGLKIINVDYSAPQNYCRIDFIVTDAFYNTDVPRSERVKLFRANMNHFINYTRILSDHYVHTWIHHAEDEDKFITFKNERDFESTLNKLLEDIEHYGGNVDRELHLLKFFEAIHWIRIINPEDLTFKFVLPSKRFEWERKLLFNKLSLYPEIVHQNEKFFTLKATAR